MAVQETGAATLTEMLSAQAVRFLQHDPPLDAARRDLADVQARNPGWNRPTSWYTRTVVRIELFISGGRLL